MPKFIGELLPKGNFALVDSDNIRGGLMQVKTIEERNSIPSDKLKIGSLVLVIDEGTLFEFTESGWAPFKIENKAITGNWALTPAFTIVAIEDNVVTVDREGLEEGDIISFNRHYATITSVNGKELIIEGDTEPELFNEVFLMGSTSNDDRSAVLILEESNGMLALAQYVNTSIESINTKCTFKLGQGPNGKWKVYGTDVHFTGDFIDKRGRNISDLAIVEYESLRREFGYDNLINNPSFITGFNCWDTENEATYFTVAGKILLTDQILLSSATNGAYVLVENGQTVLKLTEGCSITQSNSNLREIVDFEAGPNTWFDIFYTYKTINPGTISVSFNGKIKDIFNFSATDYRVHRASFKWDGVGDLSISCSGKVKLKSIVIRPNEIKTLIDTYNLVPK